MQCKLQHWTQLDLWARPRDMAESSFCGNPEIKLSACDLMHRISSWMLLFATQLKLNFS